jgi:hypothetical protein
MTPTPPRSDAARPSGSDENWLSVSDAAAAAGVAVQTIRNWINSGAIPTRTGQGPRGSRTEVDVSQLPSRRRGGAGRPRGSRAGGRARKTTGRASKTGTRRTGRGRKAAAAGGRARKATSGAGASEAAVPAQLADGDAAQPAGALTSPTVRIHADDVATPPATVGVATTDLAVLRQELLELRARLERLEQQAGSAVRRGSWFRRG